jgi:hypothetical protein
MAADGIGDIGLQPVPSCAWAASVRHGVRYPELEDAFVDVIDEVIDACPWPRSIRPAPMINMRQLASRGSPAGDGTRATRRCFMALLDTATVTASLTPAGAIAAGSACR